MLPKIDNYDFSAISAGGLLVPEGIIRPVVSSLDLFITDINTSLIK